MDDSLGDRMKLYEALYERQLMPGLPTLARVDGRGFTRWTRGLSKPFDDRLVEAMARTAKALLDELGATVAHTFSDEISLAWLPSPPGPELPFGARVQKLATTLAASATAELNCAAAVLGLAASRPPATFDGRVWQVPTLDEAANAFLWREQDAARNSVQMFARSVASHAECHEKSASELQDILHGHGINWNDAPDHLKRGSYFRRVKVFRRFTRGELEELPEKHEARFNPELEVERSEIACLDLPRLTTLAPEIRVARLFG